MSCQKISVNIFIGLVVIKNVEGVFEVKSVLLCFSRFTVEVYVKGHNVLS